MPCQAGTQQCTVLNGNDPAGIQAGFPAVAGYDQASGLGSLNVANVVNAWPLATAPVVSLSAATLAFASTTEGYKAAIEAVTLKNTGKTALTLNGTGQGIKITGTNASSFSETNTCGASVAAAGSCVITVTFKPVAVGALTASVSIADNSFPYVQTVALKGTAIAAAPIITLNGSMSFSPTAVGSTNTAPGTELINSGTAALTLSGAGEGISITGANANQFSQTNTCGATLAAGANCVITVSFKPTTSGAFVATLSVADNAAGSPQTVALSGTGTTVALSSNYMVFASTKVGVSAGTQQTTVTNKGSAALALNGAGQGIKITGTNASSFSQTNNCGTSIAAGASCVITVGFKPAATGSLTAQVSITDAAFGSPQTATLLGTGQ
jgi:hypothetical protein